MAEVGARAVARPRMMQRVARASEIRFDVGTYGKTSGAVYRAAEPIGATLVFAHGAGTPRWHPLIVGLARAVAERGVDVVTFNFLYTENGKKMPDRPEILEACWGAAIAKVRARTGVGDSPLFIGGKSMGGRFATRIASGDGLAHGHALLNGVVCVGYPLHPAGKPDAIRDEILGVSVPVLVVQGTRDELGDAAELKRFLKKRANMRVHALEGADHTLSEKYLPIAAEAIATWVAKEMSR